MMRERTIYVTDFDLKRLEQYLDNHPSMRHGQPGNASELEDELARAKIVAPTEVPPGVVTMNSRVRIVDLDSGKESVLTLVFPGRANFDEGRISILSPVGTALLGYAAGDSITWPVPAGVKRIRIVEVLYQPEAAGDFDL